MRILVCGGGQVGFSIARQLSMENNDITVIDQAEDLISTVNNTIDANGFVGHAADPEVLFQAGIGEADMLIAVTRSDETNMVACQVAHSLFAVPMKIARIRRQNFLLPQWRNLFSRDNMPIDVIISPEREVAHAIYRRLKIPGAFDSIPIADGRGQMLGIICHDDCPLVNTPLRQLTHIFPDLGISIINIVRKGESVRPRGDEVMLAGDHVYLVVASAQAARAMTAFGVQQDATHSLLILGGGNVGYFVAKDVEEESPGITTRIIEYDRERAAFLSQMLQQATILHGDVLDPSLMMEAGVENTGTVIAVTNDNETNLLSSLLAKHYGCKRAVSLITQNIYDALTDTLGIDAVVNPGNITVSTILEHVRRGRIHGVYSLGEGIGELIEAEILETSTLVGMGRQDIKFPKGVMLGAVVRGEEMILPRNDLVFERGDRIILFSTTGAVKQVEKLFAVNLAYF